MALLNYFNVDKVIADKIPELKPADGDANAQNVETLTRLCEAVSAFIDNHCKRKSGYFSAAPDTATARRYRGKGKDFLEIGVHVAGSVTVDSIASTAFYESDRNGWLYAVGEQPGNGSDFFATRPGQFWGSGVLYTVNAKWGYAETPPDILEAGMQIIEQIWDRGQGVMGDVTPAGFVIERALPLTAIPLLKPYIKRQFEAE
jgi:hypothetical protein